MNQQMQHLIVEALEHERGGVEIYSLAIECAQDEGLREEFGKYLEETRSHERTLLTVCKDLAIDPELDTPARPIVRDTGQALASSIRKARDTGDADVAELVACEAVVLAETKDHAHWELLTKIASALKGSERAAVQQAVDEVEDQEDEHLYHSKGWYRELRLKSLGLRAVLPPPEERKHVKTAIGAARAEQARASMRTSKH
jgi:rubrerythrin